MSLCAKCGGIGCGNPEHNHMPKGCPMEDQQFIQDSFDIYLKEGHQEFHQIASAIEAVGYGEWTRIEEIMEFSKRMGYQNIGLAFCRGLRWEAKIISDVFEHNGFQVVSALCKIGGIPKEDIGIPVEHKIRGKNYEPMCNPITQAAYLNKMETDFNVVVGLCVGHDSLFYKYSQALVTTLITKDRVLAHNPAGAIYCSQGYYNKKLFPEK